ncbi:MAG TPA: HWE histidine kinase domain-containing protein [Phenylobacterium sp.]|uniref:HWE histidine kinase domain-containing protein n=1 Tax=Phenylobacterium sp. TaxID=1871053 RepID=UPI002B46293D|nr:HWE histidine kinase domain-containing protein [Phenylobacterium sp.]HKR87343.1 HWE histidine kinase domain-containing protein [Phenylobacterium sp.]
MPQQPRVAAKPLVRCAQRLVVGVLAGLASLMLRYALASVLGPSEPFLPLFPMILLSALIGGTWSGVTCLIVDLVGAWYLFLGPPHSFVLAQYELGGLIGTSVVGLIILGMVSALFRLVARAKAAAEHERIIAREFAHRMRNTLTLVQAISRRTFTPARPLEDARRDFEARLGALSDAHGALLEASGETAELKGVLIRILRPFGYVPGEPRIRVEGPTVMLRPQAATAVALALHELATNAVKYGALSAPSGRVAVEWRLEGEADPELRLTWRESGGPEVVAPPSRGFGSQLIERNLGEALGGSARLEFAREGLRAEIAARVG